MFTGIIARTGTIKKLDATRLFINAGPLIKKLKAGSSIAVDGACLTVTAKKMGGVEADVMTETLQKTTLGSKKPGALVNLELPLSATADCFEGHIVTGHVEGVGKVVKIQKRGNSHLVTIQIPTALTRYVVAKGSIALNGVSLTVMEMKKNLVTVGIIPFTWDHTNFHKLKSGDKVNVETDVMAKYFEKWQK